VEVLCFLPSTHYPLYDSDLRATHARTLLPAALASVSFGFVLVRVRVRASRVISMTLGCHGGALGRLSVTTPPPPQWASHLRAASEKKRLTVVCSVFAALLVILLLYRSVCFPAVCNDSPYVKPLDKKDECVEAHQQRESAGSSEKLESATIAARWTRIRRWL
jgi:hypothetical protein